MSKGYDKRAIMCDAHKRFRYAKSRGWDEFTLGRCIKTARDMGRAARRC